MSVLLWLRDWTFEAILDKYDTQVCHYDYDIDLKQVFSMILAWHSIWPSSNQSQVARIVCSPANSYTMCPLALPSLTVPSKTKCGDLCMDRFELCPMVRQHFWFLLNMCNAQPCKFMLMLKCLGRLLGKFRCSNKMAQIHQQASKEKTLITAWNHYFTLTYLKLTHFLTNYESLATHKEWYCSVYTG